MIPTVRTVSRKLSPSTRNYDTDGRPLLEPAALALASSAGSRQDDVVYDNSRQSNFCFWLIREIPTTSAPRPVYPQQPTFWTRLGMSQVDPEQTLRVMLNVGESNRQPRTNWVVSPRCGNVLFRKNPPRKSRLARRGICPMQPQSGSGAFARRKRN